MFGVLSSASQAPPLLRRNVGLDLSAAVGIGITTALVGSLLPTVARREGLPPLGLALIAAAPFLANVLSVFSGRIGPRSPRQLALVRSVGAILLVSVALVPHPIVLAVIALGFWLTFAFGVPLQFRLWTAMYPTQLRGRMIGLVATARAAAAGVAVLIAGIAADRLGGLPAIALMALLATAFATASAGLRVPSIGPAPAYSPRASLRALAARPGLRRLVLAQAFYGGGLIAAAPLYALVQVDRLGLSLADVGTVGLLAAAATTLSSFAWGAVADRYTGVTVLQAGSALGVASLVLYAVAPGIAFLWLAAVSLGVANAALDIGLSSSIARQVSMDEQPAVMAGWNALTGIRGMIVPFAATGLIHAGLIDVTVGLLLCAVSAIIGAALFVRASSAEERPAEAPRAADDLAAGLRRVRVAVARRAGA